MHYQSMPGLYVTANLYRPAKSEGRLPAILYVCGHANVVKDGVSLGNKTGYQHHGEWFARHGYVCLIIDTVQLGEIRGEHHGTYSKGPLVVDVARLHACGSRGLERNPRARLSRVTS